MTKRIDITLEDASPRPHQSIVRVSPLARFYESSYGGVTVALYGPELGDSGMRVIEGAIRLSPSQVSVLVEALDTYLLEATDL